VRCYKENAEGHITVDELYNNLCGFDDDNHDWSGKGYGNYMCQRE
jgi:hypothetical protein